MADLNANGEDEADWPAHAVRLVAGLVCAGLLGLAIGRLVAYGYGPVAPDDARYLNVGLAVLDGRGAVTPDGNVFLLRSPVYGVALALGARVFGGDPTIGAHVVAVALTLAGFLGAVRLGWIIGGPPGGLGTGLAILATPLLWRLLPTLRIDLVQGAAIVGMLLALGRPTVARWLLAGGLFGLTILIKETALLVGLAPLAWIGLLDRSHWLRMAGCFVFGSIVVAGWWWLLVWLDAGVLFPLNAIGVIEQRDVAGALDVTRSGAALAIVLAAGWLGIVLRLRRDPPARLLALAGLAMVPPVLYATANSLSTRNYATLALLSTIALGASAGLLVRGVARRVATRSPGASRRGWLGPVVVAAAALALAVPIVARGQGDVGRPERVDLPDQLASWLAERTGPDERVVMAFRLREIVSLKLTDRLEVGGLTAVRVRPADDLTSYVWLGLRDDQLFGYRVDAWAGTLGVPGTRYLVLVEPHALTPIELLAPLEAGTIAGVRAETVISERGDVAHVFSIDPGAAGVGAPQLHLSPAAAARWLSIAADSSADGGLERLTAARAVITGDPDEVSGFVAGTPGACARSAGPDEREGAVELERC